jgi:Ni,Fe-hydrogenase III small subunit
LADRRPETYRNIPVLRFCLLVGAVSSVVPVDLVIPGCPPSPAALLKGLLALMNGGAK